MTHRWRKRDSNRRSLFSNDRDLARKQFLYSTVGLVDRCVRVGCGGGVGIGNRDRAEPSAPELMRRLPLRPVRIEQRVVLVGIPVRPAIDRDRSDVASRVEARRTQHAAELVADLLFEGHETGCEQLGTPSTVLITLRQSWAAWCPDQLNQNRLIR